MGKILVIAEKPSVGRDIAGVLGCKQKKDGYLEGEKYLVSWAIGHLVALYDPEDYDVKYKKWNFDTLPILPEDMKLKPIKKTASQLKILKSLMNSKEVDSIVCATDSGREGELIFRYIYYLLKCRKPVKRLWISSMTDAAIQGGFASLKDSQDYDSLYFSAKCRSEADWLVGMNATRAFTIKYHVLLSVGRVQTPTLAMIVNRDREIKEFIPEDYYEVRVDYGDFRGLWFQEPGEKTRIDDKKKADAIAAAVAHSQGAVIDVTEEEKQKLPPLLYDLTELQRDCNRRYGFSAKKTLDIAQSLYETKKLITYPRTDSRYLSADMIPTIKGLLQKLKNTQEFGPLTSHIKSIENPAITKRIVDDTKISDHHAIILADGPIHTDHLTEDEKKVYSAVVYRFMAVFCPNYVYKTTKIITEVKKEKFLSKGVVVLQKGWTPLSLVQEKEEAKPLPAVKKGEAVTVITSEVLSKKTQPPKEYTEATLLSAMENAGRFVEDEKIKEQLKESGLGTPATRAAIIERLLTVGYIKRKGKSLTATDKGIKLIQVVPAELKSPETTGKWEKGLHSIAKKKMEQKRFMESITRYVRFIIDYTQKTENTVEFEKEEQRGKKKRILSLGVCPQCGKGKIYENSKAYYCNEWKNGCKFTVWKNCLTSYGAEVNPASMKKLLKNQKIDDFSITLPQTGEKCTATLVLDKDKGIELKNVIRIGQ